MLSAGFNLMGRKRLGPTRDGRTDADRDQQDADDHPAPIQRISSRQKTDEYDPVSMLNTTSEGTNNHIMRGSRTPSKALSWLPAKRQPQRMPITHKRAFSVNQTDRSLPSIPDSVLSSSMSSLSSSQSRPVYVLPRSKFSASHARPRTAEQQEQQHAQFQIQHTSPPPALYHPARSLTDSNLECHHVLQLVKEADHAFGPLAVGSLPSAMSVSPKPRVLERSSTAGEFGPPARSNTTRSRQPPAQRRLDTKRKDLPTRTPSTRPPHPPLPTSQRPQPSLATAPALLPAPAISRSGPPQTRKEKKAHGKTESGGRNRLVSGKRIAENVAEIFSSFKRIEADEMLSPEGLRQMKELRELREAQRMERQKSWETVRSEPSISLELKRPSTPPTTTTSAAAMPSPGLRELPGSPENSITALNSRISIDTAEKSQPPSQQLASPDSASDSDSMTIHVYTCPSPTDSLPPVFRPELTPLPSVPQLRVTSPDGEQQRPNMIPRKPISTSITAPASSRLPAMPSAVVKSRPKRKLARLGRFKPCENDDFVFFKSNPCTITMPTFRHGDIRFAKADKDPKLGADENMDWTAFQMAILGGAGELEDFNSPGDEEVDCDASADMKLWFSSFGFSGPGQLVTDEELSQTPSTTASYSPISSSASTSNGEEDEAGDAGDARSSGPVVAFDPTSFWNRADFEHVAAPATTKLYSPSSAGMKRWTITASATASPQLTRRSLCRDSIESLPQSPMMPLVAPRNGRNTRDVDMVPMGYNLGHDLGDFLRWEAEQMYAGSFYGP